MQSIKLCFFFLFSYLKKKKICRISLVQENLDTDAVIESFFNDVHNGGAENSLIPLADLNEFEGAVFPNDDWENNFEGNIC